MSRAIYSEEAKKARAAYKRMWYARNPEKNKEYIARYWAKKAEIMSGNSESEVTQDER